MRPALSMICSSKDTKIFLKFEVGGGGGVILVRRLFSANLNSQQSNFSGSQYLFGAPSCGVLASQCFMVSGDPG